MPKSKCGYKFIDHTADVEFEASGKTIIEAVSNSILAMSETSADLKTLKNSGARDYIIHIHLKSDNLTNFVWRILQQILSEAESRDLFCYSIKSIEIKILDDTYSIIATIRCKIKSEKYSLLEVKGVSRYNLSVVHKQKLFKIHIVLDV